MRLTEKLLSWIHRAIKKDPVRFIALRLRYSTGAMTWKVQDCVLTTAVTGGPGQSLTIDLSQYTLSQLVSLLASKPGYSVSYADTSELSQLSARVLLDGEGDIATSNGDAIYGYTNLLHAFMEPMAAELSEAERQAKQAIRQMSTKTAEKEWLDELGGYYGVPRLSGETDSAYSPRIVAEVLRPRGNNVAIEAAIKTFTGQSAKVTDVVIYTNPTPAYDGTEAHNSTITHNATAQPRYGLFDVEYGYDLLNGGDISEFAQTVSGLISRLRDAGTHLRALTLTGGEIEDALTNAPTDGGDLVFAMSADLADALTAPTEDTVISAAVSAMSDAAPDPIEYASANITYSTTHNGLRYYNALVAHASGSVVPEVL